MKILILGGSGMLGHKLVQILSLCHECYATFRKYDHKLSATKIYDNVEIIDGLEIHNNVYIQKIFEKINPDIVINCIGIIKQKISETHYSEYVYVNSYFPHYLAQLAKNKKIKIINFSTDCVYSGIKGNYKENDIHDATDIYGKSKSMGEIDYENHLTIRTSIIGHELFTNYSLVDWFLSNRNKEVSGYKNAIYTGLPTRFLSDIIVKIIENYPKLFGIYNVGSERINKFSLLKKIGKKYNSNIEITENDNFLCNRSFLSDKFKNVTNIKIPSWDELIDIMYNDFLETNYKLWKKY